MKDKRQFCDFELNLSPYLHLAWHTLFILSSFSPPPHLSLLHFFHLSFLYFNHIVTVMVQCFKPKLLNKNMWMNTGRFMHTYTQWVCVCVCLCVRLCPSASPPCSLGFSYALSLSLSTFHMQMHVYVKNMHTETQSHTQTHIYSRKNTRLGGRRCSVQRLRMKHRKLHIKSTSGQQTWILHHGLESIWVF